MNRKKAEKSKKSPRERARDAVQHLRLIQHGAHIPELYRKFFPKEFAKDVPDYGDARALLAYYDRFARLVDARLFPVWEFSESDDLAYYEPESALYQMRVCLIDNWFWANRGEWAEDLHIVEKLVVSACDKERVFPDVDFRLPAGHEFSLSLLNDACLEEKGQIRRLGLVAEAVLGDTGNVWLDIGEEEYWASEMPEWTEEQIQFLADEYAEAKRMKKEIAEFFRWLNSPGKVERVKRLLRGCWAREGERVRVKAKPAPTLVEALGGLL